MEFVVELNYVHTHMIIIACIHYLVHTRCTGYMLVFPACSLLILTNPTWCQKCSMASSLGFSPPSPFNFQHPDEWTKWKRCFECFRSASGLSKESEPQQVSALLYCMGEQSDSVLSSTNISADDKKSYSSVIAKFDDYFQVRRNV